MKHWNNVPSGTNIYAARCMNRSVIILRKRWRRDNFHQQNHSTRNLLLECFMFGFDTFSGWHFPWQPHQVGLTCIYFDAKTTELVNSQANELIKSIINENAHLHMPWHIKLLMLCSRQSLLYINKFQSQKN